MSEQNKQSNKKFNKESGLYKFTYTEYKSGGRLLSIVKKDSNERFILVSIEAMALKDFIKEVFP